MSQELTFTYSGSIKNGNFQDSLPSETLKINQSTLGGEMGVRAVPTTQQAIPLGSVATAGFLYLKNLDPTNFVQVGLYISSTFYPVARLNPVGTTNTIGEVAVFRVDAGATLYWKADTAICNVQMRLYAA